MNIDESERVLAGGMDQLVHTLVPRPRKEKHPIFCSAIWLTEVSMAMRVTARDLCELIHSL